MNRVLYIAFLIFFLTAAVCYAQKPKRNFITKKDSVQDTFKLYNQELLNSINQSKFFNKDYPLIYNNLFNRGSYPAKDKSGVKLQNVQIVNDPLAVSKKNLHNFLTFQYSSLPNHSLGAAGKILSYVKNMSALYIALLSIT